MGPVAKKNPPPPPDTLPLDTLPPMEAIWYQGYLTQHLKKGHSTRDTLPTWKGHGTSAQAGTDRNSDPVNRQTPVKTLPFPCGR